MPNNAFSAVEWRQEWNSYCISVGLKVDRHIISTLSTHLESCKIPFLVTNQTVWQKAWIRTSCRLMLTPYLRWTWMNQIGGESWKTPICWYLFPLATKGISSHVPSNVNNGKHNTWPTWSLSQITHVDRNLTNLLDQNKTMPMWPCFKESIPLRTVLLNHPSSPTGMGLDLVTIDTGLSQSERTTQNMLHISMEPKEYSFAHQFWSPHPFWFSTKKHHYTFRCQALGTPGCCFVGSNLKPAVLALLSKMESYTTWP